MVTLSLGSCDATSDHQRLRWPCPGHALGSHRLCCRRAQHIENPPELKAEKSRHNKNVMKQMKNLFAEGGKLIWVAPSVRAS